MVDIDSSSSTSAKPIEPSTANILQKLCSRFRSYMDLKAQLDVLPREIKVHPVTAAALFPSTKPITSISSWKTVVAGSDKFKHKSFEATLQRGKCIIKSEILISSEYPEVAPVFKLSRVSDVKNGPFDLDILLLVIFDQCFNWEA